MRKIGPVSIAMATFNGERFIADQLESLANQTMLPAEMVVCDDKSSDDTVNIIEEFAKTSPFPVRIYRNETRLRFSENFIKSIKLCRERYISFCDQDDIWQSDKIAKSVENLQSNGALMCSHRVELIDEYGENIGVSSNMSDSAILRGSELEPWGVFLGFTCTIDRYLLKIIDPVHRPRDLIEYNMPMSHDRWFYFVAASFGAISYIDEPLALYRQHDKNVFGRTRSTTIQQIRKLSQKYPAYIKQRANIASDNVHLLRQVKMYSSSKKFDQAINRWLGIAEFYGVRLGIFSQREIVIRLKNIYLAYRGNLYSSGWGRGGILIILQDVIAAFIAR